MGANCAATLDHLLLLYDNLYLLLPRLAGGVGPNCAVLSLMAPLPFLPIVQSLPLWLWCFLFGDHGEAFSFFFFQWRWGECCLGKF